MTDAIAIYTDVRNTLRQGMGCNQIHRWWVTPRTQLGKRTPDEYIENETVSLTERHSVLVALAQSDVATVLDPYEEMYS